MSHSPSSIQFSRVLGAREAAAIGLTVSVPAAILIGGGLIVRSTGIEAPLIFVAAAVLFLPIILTYCELAVGMRGSASAYRIARSYGSPIGAFAVGWLMLGGLVALASVLIAEASKRLGSLSADLLDLREPATIFTVLIVLLAALNQWLGREEQWRVRTAIVWVAGSLLIAFAVWILILHPRDFASPPELSVVSSDLLALGLLAAGLWSIDLILNYRRLMRDPDRAARNAILVVWIGTTLLGALTALMVVRYPSLLVEDDVTRLGWVDPRAAVVFEIAIQVLLWMGLARVLSRTVRLAGAMEIHGYLPALATGRPGSWRRQLSGLSLVSTLLVPAALYISKEHLLSVSAMVFLWVTALVFLPHVRRPARELDPDRRNRLPLHPLFPSIGLASCLLLGLNLEPSRLFTGVVWLLAGMLLFTLHGRKARSLPAPPDDDEASSSDEVEEGEFQVLIGVEEGLGVGGAIAVGAAAARARDVGLVLLRVVPQGGELSIEASRQSAIDAGKSLDELSDRYKDLGVPLRCLVRIAPSVASGVAATARELACGLVVLGFRHRDAARDRQALDLLDEVFTSTGRPFAVVFGDLPEELESVVVATAGGPHAGEALRLGQEIAAAARCDLQLVHVTVRARAEASPEELLAETRESTELETTVESRVVEADTVDEGLRQVVGERSLLLLGASIDRLLGRTLFAGPSTEMAMSRSGPSVVVRRAEKATRFWMRRLWEAVSGPLPQLTVSERSEVYSQMRHSAKATIDFYMLISLASAIAALGLLLDSSAVIIGAMLVAPLMSPILATAQGIVQGNPYLIRRALVSTIKGTVTSIAVATGLTILLPEIAPTPEILGRVEPNLLDLLVAMAAGAAAAYAVSRKSVSAALPGVAISVALVPPLCVVGYGLGSSQLVIAWGALVLFLTNLFGIVLVGAVVFLLVGFRPTQVERSSQVWRGAEVAIIGLALLVVPLGLTSLKEYREQRVQAAVERVLRSVSIDNVESRSLRVREQRGLFVIEGRIWVYEEISPEEFARFRQRIEEETGFPIRLRVTVVKAELTEVGPGDSSLSAGGEGDAPAEIEEGVEKRD